MVSGSGNLGTGNCERVAIKRQPGQIEPLWQAWELAREDASAARLDWWEAGDRDRADAYSAYVAAADREAAAEDYLRAAPRQRDVSGIDGARPRAARPAGASYDIRSPAVSRG
jgi:hypothetical protein